MERVADITLKTMSFFPREGLLGLHEIHKIRVCECQRSTCLRPKFAAKERTSIYVQVAGQAPYGVKQAQLSVYRRFMDKKCSCS
jgi:hypothetical protein